MNKKLISLIVVLVLILGGLSVYVFALRGEPLTPPGDEAFTPPEDMLSESAGIDPNADTVRISARPTVRARAMGDDTLVVMFGDGSIVVFDETGTRTEEHNTGLAPVISARISPNGDHVAFEVLSTDSQSSRWYTWERTSVDVTSLSTNVRDVRFAPDNTLTRVESTDELGTRVVVENANGRDQVIYSSPVSDLTVRWIDDTSLLLGTKPSGAAPGMAYIFNTRTRVTARLLGGNLGLVALADTEQNLLFSAAENGRVLRSRILSDGEERDLGITTLPERCTLAWTAQEALCSTLESQTGATLMPDDYYKGLVTNQRSRLVGIDMQSGALISVREARFDATRPTVSANNRYVFVIDKKTGALWRLRLDR